MRFFNNTNFVFAEFPNFSINFLFSNLLLYMFFEKTLYNDHIKRAHTKIFKVPEFTNIFTTIKKNTTPVVNLYKSSTPYLPCINTKNLFLKLFIYKSFLFFNNTNSKTYLKGQTLHT